MSQAVWTGSISFGLVNIPVKLYPATEPKDVRFHFYDRRTGRRVRYERVTRAEEPAAFAPDSSARIPIADPAEPRPTGGASRAAPDESPVVTEAVEAEDLVRGLELPSGDLVTLTDSELVSIAPERSRTIDIEEFVDLADIDPVYYEKSYHLAPARGAGAEKPYVLLLRAMQAAAMVGIGRFVLRTKPHLVAIRPLKEALALETLFFGDEVRSPDAIASGLAGITVADRELKTAQQLIRAMATEWSPSRHADVYREELLELLRKKPAAAAAPVVEAATDSGLDDLMQALRASVEAAKRQRGATTTRGSKQAG